MELEGIMLSDMWNIKTKQINKQINKTKLIEADKRSVVTKRKGGGVVV